jgi:hypothetical protein
MHITMFVPVAKLLLVLRQRKCTAQQYDLQDLEKRERRREKLILR